MRFLYSDPSCYLVELSDLDSGSLPEPVSTYYESLKEIMLWARAYLTHPHALLGREGPVCPYAQPAMEKANFLLTVCPGRDLSGQKVAEAVMKYRDWFLDIEPQVGEEAMFKTILILFPDLPLSQAPILIDQTQSQLKPEFVKKGLMIGEFHSLPPQKVGVWNQDFRPLSAPVPMLVIRNMVPTDFPFLKDDRMFLSAYLEIYKDHIPPHIRGAVESAAKAYGFVLEKSLLNPRVSRALLRAGVSYKIHRHADQPLPINRPEDLAQALDYPLERITKSLFLRCLCHGKYLVVVCSVNKVLRLPYIARLVGCRRLEVASAEELSVMLSYPLKGVAPVAVGAIQVLMDEKLLEYKTVLIAAGEVEVEVELSPTDLRRVCRALLFSDSRT